MYRMSTDRVDRSNRQAKKYVQCEGQTRLGRCVTNVSERQQNYSKNEYGKILCWGCQRKEVNNNE